MRLRLISLAIASVSAVLLFSSVARQLSLVSLGLAATAETEQLLRASLADQRRLAQLEPHNRDAYRKRFEETRTLVTRLDVLSRSRRSLTRQFELTLIAVVAFIVVSAVAAYLLEQRSRTRRLARLAAALEALSRGDADVMVADRGRDVIGTFASMIERTSQVIGRERRRSRSLQHLSAWQESARILAHEIRTPLMALRLEMSRLVRSAIGGAPSSQLQSLERSVTEEIDQLEMFTGNFLGFATLSKPSLEPVDVAALVVEFCRAFATSWPGLALDAGNASTMSCEVTADRQMLRRVLVNLCKNSAMSGARHVRFGLAKRDRWVLVDVADDGPGIPPEVRSRLFEPYTTTRAPHEGMGLGLSISKKIMLDHDGDLELIDSDRGATFRLSLR